MLCPALLKLRGVLVDGSKGEFAGDEKADGSRGLTLGAFADLLRRQKGRMSIMHV
jgi:hypothetical protein